MMRLSYLERGITSVIIEAQDFKLQAFHIALTPPISPAFISNFHLPLHVLPSTS